MLTLHGLKDAVVPPYDAFIYARIYGARSPGTHTLRYVEEADHNFTGVRISVKQCVLKSVFTPYPQMPEEVVEPVLEWLSQQERGELKTGVWHTGVKGTISHGAPSFGPHSHWRNLLDIYRGTKAQGRGQTSML